MVINSRRLLTIRMMNKMLIKLDGSFSSLFFNALNSNWGCFFFKVMTSSLKTSSWIRLHCWSLTEPVLDLHCFCWFPDVQMCFVLARVTAGFREGKHPYHCHELLKCTVHAALPTDVTPFKSLLQHQIQLAPCAADFSFFCFALCSPHTTTHPQNFQ